MNPPSSARDGIYIPNITGRDSYVIRQALCYAIATISNLPEHKQESSDCEDMREILRVMLPQQQHRAHYAGVLSRTLGMPVSL